jgi:tetratricopeptide (TPR) repeat protein
MAFDGWRQARRLAQTAPAGTPARRWLPIGVAALLIVAEAVGLWGYAALGRRTFAEGMAAYGEADCRTAMQRFNRVTTLYELTLSPNVAAADGRTVECSLIVFAENTHKQGEYAEAVDGYGTYLDLYPESKLIPHARDALAETYGDWAVDLREAEKYQAAIEKYGVVLSDYPETPTGKQAAALGAETYAEWASQLREEGQYDEAIEKDLILLDEYPDTPAGGNAAALAAETYVEWGAHLGEGGQYADAIDKYDTVLGEYADTPAAGEAQAVAAETYAEWATQLREAGEYEDAIARYKIVLDEYADTPTAAKVKEPAAATYAEWAAHLRATDDYEAAIEIYQIVASEYADTSAAKAVQEEETVADTYAEWATQLREDGLYATAIRKYQKILGQYADTRPAAAAQAKIGQTYNDWGRHLHSQRKYIEAMEKFTLTLKATDDAGVIASAEEGYDEALWALSEASTGEGKQVMEQALPRVCEGKPAESTAVGLAEDKPGKALFDGSKIKLPSSLKATSPGHFRYVICLDEGTSVLQRCPYTGGHTLVRQRKWWRVRVRDTRTARVVANRTFYGTSPPACPFSRSFWSSVDYSTGNAPSTSQVIDWLQGVVR